MNEKKEIIRDVAVNAACAVVCAGLFIFASYAVLWTIAERM